MRKYTEDEFIDAVKQSDNINQVLIKLKLAYSGPSYETVRRLIRKYNLDTSHFTANSSKSQRSNRIPTENFLDNSVKVESGRLKARLLEEGYFEYKCYSCHLTTWQDYDIPIQLHHIDENRNNNNLSNLTILCPNCHALTHGYCKKKEKAKKIFTTKVTKNEDGTVEIERTLPYYSEVKERTRKVKRPDKETLQQLVFDYPLTHLGRMFGVSDNAVRKWCKRAAVEIPKNGYWQKRYSSNLRASCGLPPKPRPTKEELSLLIESKSVRDIAELFSVDNHTVKSWCNNDGIKTKPRGFWQGKNIELGLTKEKLTELSHEMPIGDIAKKYNISTTTVSKWMKREDVPAKPNGYWNKRKSKKSSQIALDCPQED